MKASQIEIELRKIRAGEAPRFRVVEVSVGDAGLTARPSVWDYLRQRTVHVYRASEREQAERHAAELEEKWEARERALDKVASELSTPAFAEAVEAVDEALLDRRVQARLATDRAYRNAENADEQADREREIEEEEIRALELHRRLRAGESIASGGSDVSTYDPVVKRWRATCPTCGYVAVRSKREAAEHALSLHETYQHEGKREPVVDPLAADAEELQAIEAELEDVSTDAAAFALKERALKVRKALASDTAASADLRQLADEVVARVARRSATLEAAALELLGLPAEDGPTTAHDEPSAKRCDECGGPLEGWAGEHHSIQCSKGELEADQVRRELGEDPTVTPEELGRAVEEADERDRAREALAEGGARDLAGSVAFGPVTLSRHEVLVLSDLFVAGELEPGEPVHVSRFPDGVAWATAYSIRGQMLRLSPADVVEGRRS